MADAAEVLPLPEEEPVDASPKSDDATASDDSGEDKGKDVSFGTFLTVGPKQYQNVTIVGYDGLRNSVRAVRRSGDTVENIQIPYEEYKTIIAAQKESDKATGRRTKKNLSGAVRGFFGKSVSLDGKSSQVIGYDAQNDEVLVNDGAGRRWIKSGEMLRSTQNISASTPLAAVPSGKAAAPATRVVQDQGAEIDPDKTEQIQRAFKEGRVTVQDPPGQRTVGLSVDSTGKVLRQVELTGKSVQASSINYISSSGASIALDDIDVAIPAMTAPLIEGGEATVTVEATTTGAAAAPTSIRTTRKQLKESRAAAPTVSVQGAASAAATVAASIPAVNTAAAAVAAAAQNVLAAYGASVAERDNQIQQLNNQVSKVSNRINDLQQRSRQALAGGNGAQAAQFEQQIIQSQGDRQSLLNQQTDLQVARINENNKASQILVAVQELTPDENGEIPEEKITAVQQLLPQTVASATPSTSVSSAAAALPRPKTLAAPRTYAPGIPSRKTSATPNPSVRTPRPIRPLGQTLSTVGGQTRRAVEFGAAQAFDRARESDDSALIDSSEQAFATEGGLPGFSGPLDSPQARVQTYAAGAGDEIAEEPDIYGAREAAGKAEMERIHASGQEGFAAVPADGRSAPQTQDQQAMVTGTMPEEEQLASNEASPQEIARATELGQAVQKAVLQDQAQKEGQVGQDQSSAAQAEALKKKIETTKRTISNLIDTFDGIHGLLDIVGLIVTFGHLNLRMALAPFERDLPFIPRAQFPYECGAIGCFDLMLCLSSLITLLMPVITFAAILGVIGGATFGLSDLVL